MVCMCSEPTQQASGLDEATDQIVVLDHGKISEQGPHDALMAIEGGIYQRLYLLQQLGE